jgi:hypothetical protein
MAGTYREYFTVSYRDDQRLVTLNDNARPTRVKLENKKARKKAEKIAVDAFERDINDLINRAIESDTRIRLRKWL